MGAVPAVLNCRHADAAFNAVRWIDEMIAHFDGLARAHEAVIKAEDWPMLDAAW